MATDSQTTDELEQAIGLANHAGLYTAADWLRHEVQRQRIWQADCRHCLQQALAASTQMISGPMIVCPACGDKRCPKADHHNTSCNGQTAGVTL